MKDVLIPKFKVGDGVEIVGDTVTNYSIYVGQKGEIRILDPDDDQYKVVFNGVNKAWFPASSLKLTKDTKVAEPKTSDATLADFVARSPIHKYMWLTRERGGEKSIRRIADDGYIGEPTATASFLVGEHNETIEQIAAEFFGYKRPESSGSTPENTKPEPLSWDGKPVTTRLELHALLIQEFNAGVAFERKKHPKPPAFVFRAGDFVRFTSPTKDAEYLNGVFRVIDTEYVFPYKVANDSGHKFYVIVKDASLMRRTVARGDYLTFLGNDKSTLTGDVLESLNSDTPEIPKNPTEIDGVPAEHLPIWSEPNPAPFDFKEEKAAIEDDKAFVDKASPDPRAFLDQRINWGMVTSCAIGGDEDAKTALAAYCKAVRAIVEGK